MLLILLSCLISIATICILFFRIKYIKQRSIPSWFLGKESKNIIKNKIIFTKPPIIPIALVILVTIAFAVSFYPQKNLKSNFPINKSALVWLDPSLQSKLSRAENDFSPSLEAEKILSYGFKNYGLKNSFEIKDEKIKIEFKIIALNSKKEIKEFLENQNSQPASPFTQSIDTEKLTKILNNNEDFFNKKNTFIALSDGNIDSLQGLYSLKNFFDDGILLKTKYYESTIKSQKEIVPTEIYTLWNEKITDKSAFSFFNTQKSQIPEEARPHFYINTLQTNNDPFYTLNSRNLKKSLPLFIGCTNRLPSPIELDPFSSLRILVSFFGNDFIEKSCDQEKNENHQNKNVWKYRNATVWVVPINDRVNSTMNDDLTFWIPEGFDTNYDTLVYTAGLNPTLEINRENELKKVPVQLDEGSFPLPLYLMQPPPGAELGIRMAGDTRVYKGVFKPFYNAADGTQLAWKSTSLPFFYLRTATATPNGELGRSRTWTHFWFKVAQSVKRSNLSYTKIELSDISKLNEDLEGAEINSQEKFLEILDLKTLDFVPAKFLTNGLYRIENKQRWVFIAPTNSGKNTTIATQDDFKQAFSYSTDYSKKEKEINKGESLYALFAAICGSIFLLILWWNPKKINIILISIFSSIICLKNKAFCQPQYENLSFPFLPHGKSITTNIENENIPFRVAWCAKEIPLYTKKKYEELRNILMKRGTILLPKELKENACTPGNAEIWWTDTASDLNIKNLLGHISNGGIFILEGNKEIPTSLYELSDQSVGMIWETPKKRGMFYRSFYLLQSLDGCFTDSSNTLTLKKKVNAQAPYGLITSARFLSSGEDCFKTNNDYRMRSFINIMYSFLTTDYKEDQLQLPEILNRIRNLGLEP